MVEHRLVTDGRTDIRQYAEQLKQAIAEVLDELAPKKVCKKRCGRRSNRRLSATAVDVKRNRRRLERRWTESRLETDRVAHRAAYPSPNRIATVFLSTASRRSSWQSRVATDDRIVDTEPAEAKRLCRQFSEFLAD